MKVCELMSKNVISVGQDASVSAAARLMKQYNVGAVPVCDGRRRLRGMLTDRDIVTRCVAGELDPAETRVAEIMSRGILTVSPEETPETAAGRMRTDQVRRLPVLEEGRLVGMLTLCDLARNAAWSMEAAAALSEISANVQRR